MCNLNHSDTWNAKNKNSTRLVSASERWRWMSQEYSTFYASRVQLSFSADVVVGDVDENEDSNGSFPKLRIDGLEIISTAI